MRSFAYVLLAVVAAAGCAESAAPSFPHIDAGRDASIDPDGGNGGNGGNGGEGGEGGATGVGGSAGSGGSSGPWCLTSKLCPQCPNRGRLCDELNPCPVGEDCLLTGCQECDDTSCVDLSRCFVAGAGACQEPADCPDPYTCDESIGRCLRTDGRCDDSNDCIAGFACEDGSCVDRRLPCAVGSDCPHGYTCFFAPPDQRFCRRITRPCADDFDCLVLGVPCGDADEDGRGECMPSLVPNEPAPISCDKTQCLLGAGPVCETTVEGKGAVCGQFGLCADSTDCDEGFDCRDLWGDGRMECVWPLESCVDSRDCAPRELCASPREGGAPTCVGEQAM